MGKYFSIASVHSLSKSNGEKLPLQIHVSVARKPKFFKYFAITRRGISRNLFYLFFSLSHDLTI